MIKNCFQNGTISIETADSVVFVNDFTTCSFQKSVIAKQKFGGKWYLSETTYGTRKYEENLI